MEREEIKRRVELYSALAEGKAIQVQNPVTSKWEYLDINKVGEFMEELNYRIKPEPKYRPFTSQEECWNEMLKHQPFGWVKSKKSGSHFSIGSVLWDKEFDDVFVTFACDGMLGRSSKSMFEDFTFSDGTPFGIKEE